MEEVRQAILQIAHIHDEIIHLLAAHSPNIGSATYGMLKDATSVSDYTRQIGAKSETTTNELNLVLGVTRSFNRHLSEVEQTVYEEIGGEQLDQLTNFINRALIPYNRIWDYQNEKT